MNSETTRPYILVIDDEIQMRRLLQRTLEENHYKVFLAETGEQGLQRASMDRPEVIILDLGLPNLDGVQVLKRLPLLITEELHTTTVQAIAGSLVRVMYNG